MRAGYVDSGINKNTAANNYEAAISSEAERVALNGLTDEVISQVRARREKIHFSTKGVNALGTAERYLNNLKLYGNGDKRTRQADITFEYDLMTGLFEETEDIHSFHVSYPVEGGRVMMGDMEWSELTARGTLDESTEGWYGHRAYVETREPVIINQMLDLGELETNDVVTISNTSTAKNASDYFNGRDLMIRRISYNKAQNTIEIDQLKMPSIDNEMIAKLFAILEVPVDTATFTGSEDESVKYLATQIKVKKGELLNGSADIGFLLDCILNQETGGRHVFGRQVDGVIGNPYAALAEASRDKERKRTEAVQFLRQEFLIFAKKGRVLKQDLREVYQTARSIVADIEGKEFVRSRYGDKAASSFEKKQRAVEAGDMTEAAGAEMAMQEAMGDPSVCGTVMSAGKAGSESTPSTADSIYCPRLPQPGEIARCPCCREKVVVAGTKEKIACSKAGCKLEDPSLKKKRDRREKLEQKKSLNPKKEFKIFDFSHFKKAKLERDMRQKSKHEIMAA